MSTLIAYSSYMHLKISEWYSVNKNKSLEILVSIIERFSSEWSLLSHVQHLSQSWQRMEMFWVWKVSIARAELKIPVNLVRKDEKLGRLAREPESLSPECSTLSWMCVIYLTFSRIPKAILKWVLSTLVSARILGSRYSDSHTPEFIYLT